MGTGFEAASGYGQLPNGKWSPTIYSKNVLQFFRTLSVAEEITNTDYTGEIKTQGDTVKIMKEPVISVRSYKRGQKIEPQDLTDEDLELTVDQANYFAFRIDDIEKQMSHIDWENKAVNGGAYSLRKAYDINILDYMVTNATLKAELGVAATPLTIGYGNANSYTPLDYINHIATLFDENDVPEDQRYIVANPRFWEQLAREDSSLVQVDITGDPESVIRARKLATSKMLHGFMCLKSNNLPLDASGNRVVLAGHKSAVATATTILESKSQELIDTFGNQFKSLQVFGRKVLRPEALFAGSITIGDVD